MNQSIVPCLILSVASCPAYRFLRRQVRWSGTPISLGIFQFVVIHTVKGLSRVNGAHVFVFFWNFHAFSMTQHMLAIWSLGPLPFLNPAYIKCFLGNSNFLKEITSLSILLFSLFLCICHWRRLSFLSLLFSGTLQSKTKIMASNHIPSWQIYRGKVRYKFLGLQNQCRQWLQPQN